MSAVASETDSAGPHSEAPPERPRPAVEQEAVPYAVVLGKPVNELPKDLYIPPDALEVILEAFEGPLDLLLYLIKRQNLDVLDIPIAQITHQYMAYIELMKDIRLELAAEYLVMAAMLAEIKSRMLLPRPTQEGDEDDPRAELVRRLQEYERFKHAAQDLDELPRMGRDVFQACAQPPDLDADAPLPQVDLREILLAFSKVLTRAEQFTHHHIRREPLSVRERMSTVLDRLSRKGFTEFRALFAPQEGRAGVVVTLLAVLELIKEQLLELTQSEPFAPIHVRVARGETEAQPEAELSQEYG
jgi:segregation and condensation protein A